MWHAAHAAPGVPCSVVRVLRRVELRWQVALGAYTVARSAQLQRVRLVTVRAGDSLRVHPALHERAPVVDLVAHLPVVPVETVLEQCQPVRVLRRLAVDIVVGDAARAAVAPRARLDLAGRRPRRTALRVSGPGHRRPGDTLALVQRDREALARRERLPVALPVRPRDMAGAGPVARLARDVDLVPLRVEGAGLRVEVLPQVGRVALGALEVPVLLQAGPVQRIAGLDVLARIEVEPALAALRLRPRIPRDAQGLHAAAGQLDQVLLQRTDAERILDLVVGELAVRPVGVDDEPVAAAREGRGGAGVGEPGVGEVAQHRLPVGNLHRQIVVGAFPRRVLPGMAGGAQGGTNVFRHGRGDGNRRRRDRRWRPVALHPERVAGGQRQQQRRETGDPGPAPACSHRGQGRTVRRDYGSGCAAVRRGLGRGAGSWRANVPRRLRRTTYRVGRPLLPSGHVIAPGTQAQRTVVPGERGGGR